MHNVLLLHNEKYARMQHTILNTQDGRMIDTSHPQWTQYWWHSISQTFKNRQKWMGNICVLAYISSCEQANVALAAVAHFNQELMLRCTIGLSVREHFSSMEERSDGASGHKGRSTHWRHQIWIVKNKFKKLQCIALTYIRSYSLSTA